MITCRRFNSVSSTIEYEEASHVRMWHERQDDSCAYSRERHMLKGIPKSALGIGLPHDETHLHNTCASSVG